MQQVQQELQMQMHGNTYCIEQQQQQQGQPDGATGSSDVWEWCLEGQPSSSNTTGSSMASLACLQVEGTRRQQQQQRQEYSIVRTGGGYQACIRDAAAEAAESLLRSAAVHGQLPAASAAASAAAGNSSSSSCTAKLAAALPRDVVAVMQDFYRQYCCVQWPLATAARCVSAAGATRPPQAAGSPTKAGSAAAAAAAGDGNAGEVVLQPLLPWHVLEGLLLLLNRVGGLLHVLYLVARIRVTICSKSYSCAG
jgi:hypothetical protein